MYDTKCPVLTASYFPMIATVDANDRFDRCDAGIREMLAVSGTPSLSYTIVQRGKTLRTRHFGYRDVANELVPNDQTRHSINSMTKAVVAALTGILASQGVLDMYAPVKTYLPRFACHDPRFDSEITIVDLLSHRTGITNFDPIWLGSHNALLLHRDDTLKTFAALKQCEPFRTSFVYNNWGYEVVAKILEYITKRSLDNLLAEHIFKPLGMSRTSTSWDLDDGNSAKSYAVLHDLTSVPIGRPDLSPGKVMEAAGGIKSTIEDVTRLYTAYLHAIIDQTELDTDSTSCSVFHHCRDIVTNHARLPGTSLREQGYGAGFVRAQLPGQLGRISLNPSIGPQPVVGKGSESRLVLYHHGSMPGSTSCVHLIPGLDAFIVVLQNSLAPIDTADFVCQYLLETLLDAKEPNDYPKLAAEFTAIGLGHMDRIKQELDGQKRIGTAPRPLCEYSGNYWNEIKNFFIQIVEKDGKLQMRLQGRESETFDLVYYKDETFTWWMPYDEIARRGRYIGDYAASYYLINFSSSAGKRIDTLGWAWDSNTPDKMATFTAEPRRGWLRWYPFG
ncbi:hypothetical protein NEMBOFW57_007297 [Staphylotrichum longicolle]|uniref:Beta-lactamase/transpeptidase-like protein n=1 Tax=Staphylotrichum longicolle TaxID=669026 RepID=A0AAD4EY27_9PEZI|nr:hypothetical protein NEMBOFW57_007297 [Staphylotrichum longicolle]